MNNERGINVGGESVNIYGCVNGVQDENRIKFDIKLTMGKYSQAFSGCMQVWWDFTHSMCSKPKINNCMTISGNETGDIIHYYFRREKSFSI